MNSKKKATAIEASVLVVSGALAAALGALLADHDVSIAAIIGVVAFTLTTGQYLANSLTQALRTTLYDCPAKGCAVSIRVKGIAEDERASMRAYAVDHSKHGAAR